jgi:hypothetical protein
MVVARTAVNNHVLADVVLISVEPLRNLSADLPRLGIGPEIGSISDHPSAQVRFPRIVQEDVGNPRSERRGCGKS